MSGAVIVDSGVGNLASVQAAFARVGATVEVSHDPRVVSTASRLVIPGVGSFGAGLASLRSKGLDAAIREAYARGTPVLAICLGLQMLTDESDESPGIAGLGLLKGRCSRLPDEARLPHLGWNRVVADPACRTLSDMDAFFANSYALSEAPPGWNAAWTTHGTRFLAAMERDAMLVCQFHPELSGSEGIRVIERWLRGQNAVGYPRLGHASLAARIVPCLDVQGGRVVKGIHFANLRDAGDVVDCATRYEDQGADEIVVLDITASADKRATQIATVRAIRRVLSIPLTVGGGVRSVDDARRLLAAGADKVSVNSAAVARPALLAELAAEFGSQCVVLAIDARVNGRGWDVLVLGGRQRVEGFEAVDWARRGAASGAGEILLTSWDRDGTRRGCDLPLLRAIRTAVNVPVIASGGIGSSADAADALEAGADAVLAASILHDGDGSVAGIKTDLAGRGIRVRQ